MFFFAQSGGAVRSPSARYSGRETNCAAASEPGAVIPPTVITNPPVLESSNRLTMPKSSVTSQCFPNWQNHCFSARVRSCIQKTPSFSANWKRRLEVISSVHRLLNAPMITAGELRKSSNENSLPILTWVGLFIFPNSAESRNAAYTSPEPTPKSGKEIISPQVIFSLGSKGSFWFSLSTSSLKVPGWSLEYLRYRAKEGR